MTVARWGGVDLGPVGQKIAQILESYPGDKSRIYITSGRDSLGDHGFASHHNEGHFSRGGSPTAAIDVGFGGAGNPSLGRDVAKWLYENFWSDTVELIHTTPFNDDQGFYVKDGTRHPGGGPYAGATAASHADHIHWALSLAQAQRILSRLPGVGGTPAPAPATPGAPVGGWHSLAPATTIFAVDLSDFDSDRGNNPSIVRRYRTEGVAIVSHKTTETAPGEVFRHVKLGAMLGAARDGGVPFLGGYVVPRSGPSVAAQGANHIAFLDQQVPWWRGQPGFFHQVDLERWPYDSVSAGVGNALYDWLKVNGGGKPVVVYASKGQYGSDALRFPRWNANYPNETRMEYRALYASVGGNNGPGWEAYGNPSRSAELWQYASTGIVSGQHTTDISAFRGSESEFARALGFPASGGDTVTPKEEYMLIRPIGKSTVHGGERSAVYTTNGQSRIWLKSSADVLDVQGALRACGLHAEIVPVGSGANFGPIVGDNPGDV